MQAASRSAISFLRARATKRRWGRCDLAQNIIRPLVQKNVPGTVAISPFGPNMRSIIVNVDPNKLLQYNLNPLHVVEALKTGNVVIPSGNIYVKDSMPMVYNNATVVDIQK